MANEIDTGDRGMSEVINALKSKGLIQRATSKILGPMPKLRDFALHAEWDKLSEPAINSLIAFVDQFPIKHFRTWEEKSVNG